MLSHSEESLVSLCLSLIGDDLDTLSVAERKFLNSLRSFRTTKLDSRLIKATREKILRGKDPLGDLFSTIRSAEDRRNAGAVYTPWSIVQSMTDWLAYQGSPQQIIDPGAGSGRFLLKAGSVFPQARLMAIENDPLAVLMLRANLAVRGWTSRASVFVNDYRSIKLPRREGVTAFIGNPPYVRHHHIPRKWKEWYASNFASLGINASERAGLHLHFFLKTCLLAKAGDLGVLVTSAEWLDVNYGAALRSLLLEHLEGTGLHVLEPTVEAFPGTATTAAIICFHVGCGRNSLKVRSVDKPAKLGGLVKGRDVSYDDLRSQSRWSAVIRPRSGKHSGGMELGELFRVHRGQVTGANIVWLDNDHAKMLPRRVKWPAVTKAKDLIEAGACLQSIASLRRVIDLPADLSCFVRTERRQIEKFLAWAKSLGADQTYIARHRKAWWSVGLKPPAPILCTYMARRPPQFTLNPCGARHINVAHGLYPKECLPANILADIVAWLNENVSAGDGRTYAGGLTKFEPREIERLRIPNLEFFTS